MLTCAQYKKNNSEIFHILFFSLFGPDVFNHMHISYWKQSLAWTGHISHTLVLSGLDRASLDGMRECKWPLYK